MNTVPKKREDLMFHRSGADLVLHDDKAGKVYVLNGTARTVWEMCDGKISIDAICDELAKFPGAPARVEITKDVTAAMSDLLAQGLFQNSVRE